MFAAEYWPCAQHLCVLRDLCGELFSALGDDKPAANDYSESLDKDGRRLLHDNQLMGLA
jgi:hypothetical protein